MDPSLKINLLHYVTVFRTNVVCDRQCWDFAARIRKELSTPSQQGTQDDDDEHNGFPVRRKFAWGTMTMPPPIEVNNIDSVSDQLGLTS